jgi:hypothetical protein
MGEQRKHIRYAAPAAVRMEDGQMYSLKDISAGGCCLKCPLDYPLTVRVAQDCRIVLTPEPEAQVEPFSMILEPCWIQDNGGFREIGCFITGFPEGKRYQCFANYLAWRASRG